MKPNSWRIMWLLVVFDFPTQTKIERRRYSQFRKRLLEEGFLQMQFSVYIRNTPTFSIANSLALKLGKTVPEKGKCSFLFLTDKQYGLTVNFYGKKKEKTEKEPQQLLLFS